MPPIFYISIYYDAIPSNALVHKLPRPEAYGNSSKYPHYCTRSVVMLLYRHWLIYDEFCLFQKRCRTSLHVF
jgi:hypothetical protein